MRGHLHVDDDAAFFGLLGGNEVLALGNLRRGPEGRQLALCKNRHVGGKPHDLRHRMADIDDGDLHLVAQPLEIGHDLCLSGSIERGERLVHQQQLWRGEQCAPDGHALLLATGKIARAALQQMCDAEQVENLCPRRIAFRLRREPFAIGEVALHRQVRKQPRLLEHIADAPSVRQQVDAVRGVHHHRVADADPRKVGPDQPGDDIDQRGLAATRGAEHGGDAAGAGERGFQGEVPETVADIDGEAHAAIRCPARRARNSDTMRAASEMAIEMAVSLSAPASPPGTCVSV